MSNTSYKKTFEPALLYGGITGGAIILHSIILYTLNASFSVYAQVTGYLLPIALITLVLYLYRKEYLGGYMTYTQGLGMGSLIMVIAGIIGAVYMFIFLKYIDPGFIKVVFQMQEDKMLEKGMDEAAIEQAMAFTEKMRSVGVMTAVSFISTAFMGFVFSAIVSIFLKKEPKDPFAAVEEK
jgi:hypothetical protein